MLGSTPASTALVEYEIDTPLTLLAGKIGRERAERAWRRSYLALHALAARTRDLGIRADLRRADNLYLAGNVLDADGLAEEAKARARAGIETKLLPRRELKERFGIRRSAALLAYDDVALDPRRLTAGYLNVAIGRGARLFAPTDVSDVEAGASGVSARTAGGPVIRCKSLVFATGYEMPDSVPKRAHQVFSTWAIATRPQPRKLWPEDCFIWEAADPYLYLRSTPDGRVICGGEDEEFSDDEARDALIPKKAAAIAPETGAPIPATRHHPGIRLGGRLRLDRDRAALDRRRAGHGELSCRARLRRQRHHLRPDRRRHHRRGAVGAARSGRRPLCLQEDARHAVMRMADGDGERIRRVVAVEGGAREKHPDHRPDLLLLGMAGADDRLLDLVRRILGHCQPRLCRYEERDTPRLSELQGRRGVTVDEGLLDRRLVGHVGANHFREPAMDGEQPMRQFAIERRMDRARGDKCERVAARGDDPQPV